jgi:hypothetical protein
MPGAKRQQIVTGSPGCVMIYRAGQLCGVAKKARADGFSYRKSGKSMPLDVACMGNPDDLGAAALYKVANDMVSGVLTPDEAQAITGVIANHIKLHEAINIEDRLSSLETALGDANTTP